jgi:SAM-dependent methyltransferase
VTGQPTPPEERAAAQRRISSTPERTDDPKGAKAAAHYAGLDDPDSQTSPPFVRNALGAWLAATSLDGAGLDLGAGVGANLELLRGRHRVVGSEISESAAKEAATIAPVAVADGARLPFADSSFGFVVCTEVLEHVDDPSAVFAEMARVLRPGGLAFVTTPNYANLAGLHKKLADRRSGRHDWNPWGAHHGGFEAFMTGRRLAAFARPHLEIVRARGLDFGQALTGRFRPLDRAAWSKPGLAVLRRLLPALDRRSAGRLAWHGMHVELVLRRGR